jgi:hypothetical protein
MITKVSGWGKVRAVDGSVKAGMVEMFSESSLVHVRSPRSDGSKYDTWFVYSAVISFECMKQENATKLALAIELEEKSCQS